MTPDEPLVGRERERGELMGALDSAARGEGGLVLVAGEAGIGKTALAHEVLGASELLSLEAAPWQGSAPYATIVAVLRSYRRQVPDGLQDLTPVGRPLGALLPELGRTREPPDPPTLVEAIRWAFETIARRQPMAVFVDDLQWADEATLELLPVLATELRDKPLLILAAYRSDELRRGHPVRRLRAELRRGRVLRELTVETLGPEPTAELAARILGRKAGPRLARTVHDRTGGLPFFVEELLGALVASGTLEERRDCLELAPARDLLPVPDTVREAVLLRADPLSPAARRSLEVAVAAGLRFELGLVAELGGTSGLEELLERGLVLEVEPGIGGFRHALVRESFYSSIPWTRRRAHHRALAERLEAGAAAPELLAEHWLAAGEPALARPWLLAAADAFCAVHGYRDASRALERAVEMWPAGEDEPGRLTALERLGHCGQLAGDLAGAARALEEVAEQHRSADDCGAVGDLERQLASVYELQGLWEQAVAARERAAAAFGASGQVADAAAERLAAASHLTGAGGLTTALGFVSAAWPHVEEASDPALRASALVLEGQIRAGLGDGETGVELARQGLELALASDLPDVVVDAYYRFADALEHVARYRDTIDAMTVAYEFCREREIEGMAEVCLACLAPAAVRSGEWSRAEQVCNEVLRQEDIPPVARMVARAELGLVLALRGNGRRARPLLADGLAFSRHEKIVGLEIEAVYGLARIEDPEAAAARMRHFIEWWAALEERHYVVPPLRWGSTLFAQVGDAQWTSACAEGLSQIAAATGQPEALGAVAHALGELALLHGDPDAAVRHLEHAVSLVAELPVPLARAESQLRAGIALAAAGDRERAVARLTAAYRTARKLGARPVASLAVAELAALGEKVDARVGRRGRDELERAGLSRRELEVLRLVSAGRTNREIAGELFLSSRTVDMHVRNILTKLDCRSRTAAARQASELGLLEPTGA